MKKVMAILINKIQKAKMLKDMTNNIIISNGVHKDNILPMTNNNTKNIGINITQQIHNINRIKLMVNSMCKIQSLQHNLLQIQLHSSNNNMISQPMTINSITKTTIITMVNSLEQEIRTHTTNSNTILSTSNNHKMQMMLKTYRLQTESNSKSQHSDT